MSMSRHLRGNKSSSFCRPSVARHVTDCGLHACCNLISILISINFIRHLRSQWFCDQRMKAFGPMRGCGFGRSEHLQVLLLRFKLCWPLLVGAAFESICPGLHGDLLITQSQHWSAASACTSDPGDGENLQCCNMVSH
jgi:hypothetical protein